MKSKINRSIEEKIEDALNKVGNLHPDLRLELENDLILLPELCSSVIRIKQYVTKKLNIPSFGKHTKQYWLSRGWNEVDSYFKSKDNAIKNRISPFSREFWLVKINPETNTFYTEEEADFERNSRRPIYKEYWMKKGHSEEDAVDIASKTKYDNVKAGVEIFINMNPSIRKAKSHFCVEYWERLGLTKEDRDNHMLDHPLFTLDYCKERYGDEEGYRVWKERQDNWQETLKTKTQEETDDITKRKNPFRLALYDNIDDAIISFNDRNVFVVKTKEDFVNLVTQDLEQYENKKYQPVEKYIKNIKAIQLEILGITRDAAGELIKHLFSDASKFLNTKGNRQSIKMWTDKGLLRSSFEILFYEKFMSIDENIIVKIDGVYNNKSRYRYDFLLNTGEYIEICPTFNDKGNDNYTNKMLMKEKTFGAILLKNSEEIINFFNDYKDRYFPCV